MITKTNYREFLSAPMHFWASKHGKIEIEPSLFELHLMKQGQEIEGLANQFITLYLNDEKLEVTFQKTFLDGEYQARADIVSRSIADNIIDIYEVKSACSIKKEDKHDVAFQRLVCEATENVGNAYLVYLNKEYVFEGDLDLGGLFLVEKMDDEIDALRDEVMENRELARQISHLDDPFGVEPCLKPKDCPCPSLCHGDLPHYPIYDIPYLGNRKKRALKEMGILSIQDVPPDFPLSDKQRTQVEVVRSANPLIKRAEIKASLDSLAYPLSFLDYETYNPAVPLFDGYKPYEPIVFQYSLHLQESPGSEYEHFEGLFTDNEDPSPQLCKKLQGQMPDQGSVVVWYKPFETSRNREMADRYPAYRDFLEGVNARVYDLMEIFSTGLYTHPDFHGSASIKNVLPVLVPDIDQGYPGLQISNGEEAMLAWIAIISGQVPSDKVDEVRSDLLAYCHLDTLAMVKILEALNQVTAG